MTIIQRPSLFWLSYFETLFAIPPDLFALKSTGTIFTFV